MLRARFLQDTVIIKNNDFVKRDKERDLDFSLGLELFREHQVDILNPYEHNDLFENIEKYAKDWSEFVNITKNDVREENVWN